MRLTYRQTMVKNWITAFVFLLSSAFGAFAQAEKVQDVITGQLEAFSVDDFDGAFEYAAPNIQMMFKSPENFEQMVTNGYPMVHRNRSYTFGEYTEERQFSTQIVNLEATNGSVYQLRYDLVATQAGWKIMGVQILSQTSTGV